MISDCQSYSLLQFQRPLAQTLYRQNLQLTRAALYRDGKTQFQQLFHVFGVAATRVSLVNRSLGMPIA